MRMLPVSTSYCPGRGADHDHQDGSTDSGSHVARAFRHRYLQDRILCGGDTIRRISWTSRGLPSLWAANRERGKLPRRRCGSRCGKQTRRSVYRNCLQDRIRSKFGNDLPEAGRFGHHRSDAVYPATERGRHLATAQYEPRESQRTYPRQPVDSYEDRCHRSNVQGLPE
jgi:hypothetical protein